MRAAKPWILAGSTFLGSLPVSAYAQTVLPSVTVTEPAHKARPAITKPPRRAARPTTHVAPAPRVAGRTRPATSAAAVREAPGPQVAGAQRSTTGGAAGAGGPDDAGIGSGAAAPVSPALAAARANEAQAQAVRAHILPRAAANATTITKQNIDALPAGDQTSFDRVLLQLPGVTQDSSGSGDFHIRNEHANAQYRINGIFLPEGVSGFSQVLDSVFIRSLTLLDGALPAQYGLRTAGIIDIETRTGTDNPGTVATIYGGSQRTILPTISESGTTGRWDYFATGRYNANDLGIENPQPTHDAIHDATRQGRYFAYLSGNLENDVRLTFMSGAVIAKYQIPDSPDTPPAFTAFGVDDFNSSLLNENQIERSIFNVLALQKSIGPLDSQLSYFQRYSTLAFTPDPIGDIVFNGVASNVARLSLVNGLQSDNAYTTSARNTVRFGFIGEVESADAIDDNVVLPTNAAGDAVDRPFSLDSAERKTGGVAGVYLQDEYDLTRQIAVTGGLRYDYMNEYVTADQLSPRLGVVYKPTEATTFHAGYARYFTPPELALSAPTDTRQFAGTTLQPDQFRSGEVKPERSHYFDAGVTQRVLPGLEVGLDGYYKIAKNLLDDGQFGQALVLTAFNYDHAYNDGVELKANYVDGGFRAYGNLAVAQQRAKQVSSNQYLFDADELAFISDHYIFTDHDQLITVSGGVQYRIRDTLLSTDVIYGSGLRDGFANTGTVAPHAVVNVGVAQDFHPLPNLGPTTARITVVNLLDHAYFIRDGSGIGVFQAQYGERRGVFAGLSQRF